PGLQGLPADDAGAAFTGMDARLSDRHVQAFYLAADAIASALSSSDQNLTRLATSCALDAAPAAACVDRFLDGFAMRAFRRPLTTDERARYSALNDGTRDGRELFRALVLSLLMTPDLLYHLEIAGTAKDAAETNLDLSAY